MEILQATTKLNALSELLSERYVSDMPEAFKTRKDQAVQALEKLDFPTTKQEYWKYTRTGLIANKSWRFADNFDLPELPIAIDELTPRMVFVNGVYNAASSELEDIQGLEISEFSKSKGGFIADLEPYINYEKTPFLALNMALPQNGYAIRVSKNTVIEKPINIINVYTGDTTISQPRSVIVLEQSAELKLTEFHIHVSEKPTLSNTALEVQLGANATLGIDVIQKGNTDSYHMQQLDAVVASDSHFTHNNFTMRGRWTRNNGNVRLKGSNITANLNGFYIPNGAEHIDNHTIMDHEQPHCDSNELYRGVLLGKSTAVFNGKVYVRPDAQKTNAFQSNGNILVSDDATVNSKPELEIYADDVKCSHGSTTGQIDEEALYYLRTRGLSETTARKMMVGAFAADVLNEMANPVWRKYIEDVISYELSKA